VSVAFVRATSSSGAERRDPPGRQARGIGGVVFVIRTVAAIERSARADATRGTAEGPAARDFPVVD